MSWARAGIVFFSAAIGTVVASVALTLLTGQMSTVFAVLMAAGFSLSIGGVIWSWSEEASAIEATIGLAVAEAWRDARHAETPARTPHVPEAARPLHDDMTAAVAQARESIASMAKIASAMHRDRVAVHEHCAALEAENEHLTSQVATASQARDVLALLHPAPLRLEPPKTAPNLQVVDTEGFMARLSDELKQNTRS